ncbi:phosphinothricin acetyltransferase [Tenacibaculum sp. MAR_2009_124]|uniref:GNAT family N-acetyltransferase n=1 Tax=Tenacibaculum sp. MAR_2009_124 TaxID=1250059 RepID=UPI0008972D27|nr:GNAT family N-acetyltransferase [Tenacibaculum sp. MAR_2009_124]SED04795.1 phosphinothricin acetyltransferase [Tenacibaculum sp. MAR_2009_124]
MEVQVEKLSFNHWGAVAGIYQEGIDTGNATFRTEVPNWNEWNVGHHEHSRFIALIEGMVVGWSALAPVSSRFEYRGVAEVSVYVALSYLGNGIGGVLMERLISSSEENNIWTLYSSLFPENVGSIKLHEKKGFRFVGTRKKIAQLHGVWRDTSLYERRSTLF